MLDKERPDILAWLTICAVELGNVQIAKQGFRQLMQFEDLLESSVALELARIFLRFSNEQKASEWGGERGRLVQDGRYAKEAAMVAKMILARAEVGEARQILAWSLALDGEHAAAAGEFCAAMPLLVVQDPNSLDQAAEMARHCASMVPGEPQLVAMVEEAQGPVFFLTVLMCGCRNSRSHSSEAGVLHVHWQDSPYEYGAPQFLSELARAAAPLVCCLCIVAVF